MSAQNFELPERLRRLEVSVKGDVKADLLREGPYSLVYSASATNGDAVSLLMPTSKQVYTNGELFPSMDMNLPEGYLFQRILELHRKFKIQKLHLLALAGESGIGRVGFRLPDAPVRRIAPVSRQEILSAADGETMFEELMRAYLQGGSGISGVQPKVMVPSRATLPAPDLIIKVAGAEFPGLSANEFMCLSAGRHAGIEVPGFDLSQDGKILVIDRFDRLVPKPQDVISRIAEGMSAALGQAQGDERIPRQLLEQMRPLWDEGMRYAIEATRQPSTTPASRRVRRP